MRNAAINKWLALILLSGITAAAFSQESTTTSKRPNILVILADDMGYSDIGCFGAEIATPNIDRLAANGLRFTHFYNTSRCSPSRASLLTGLYPHQAGMGFLSSTNYEEEGYRDDLSRNAVTMAEVFKASGYSTYMTGKWHINKDINPDGDKTNWPRQRGFQRFFGTLNGAGSFYDPGTLVSDNSFIAPGRNFYYTNAISDTAVKFIREHPKDNPFFFYVAYTTAHWPLHAPEEEVQKGKGQYDKGWDFIRQQRLEKQKKLGIISDKCVLSERSPAIPAWKDETMKEWQARRMEVYAAMIRIMDRGIGRIISALKEQGELENTIIFYLHDNGGCAEPQGADKMQTALTPDQQILRPFSYDSVFYGKRPEYSREGHYVRSGKGVMPGGADTWVAYGEEWANVSNTPFRLYKHNTCEGGIATPLIVFWPAGITAKGGLRAQNAHLIDIMATCLDITGSSYPKTFNGHAIQPFEGKSLVPAFTGRPIDRKYIFWEHEGNRAIRDGNWKLVSQTKKKRKFTKEDENAWELYDTEADPSETINLASRHPDKVKQLAAAWEKEAFRTKAKPWPWSPKVPYVRIGSDGSLIYRPDENGNIIPDFSRVGYHQGDKPLPGVKVVKTVFPPSGGSSQQLIQQAIDEVSAHPPDANGFRGAILLKKGTYLIPGTLRIAAGGIVLRGEGDSAGGTRLVASGKEPGTLLVISGAGAIKEIPGTRTEVTDRYVPVGQFSFHVEKPGLFRVGDPVILYRPGTDKWIKDLKMDKIVAREGTRQWQAEEYNLSFERKVIDIKGSTLFIDQPVVMPLEKQYGGAEVFKYSFDGRISEVGIENILFESEYATETDEAHAWNAIDIDKVEHAWVKQVTSKFFCKSCVHITGNARYITVTQSRCLDPKSVITGMRRYSFDVNGQFNLVRDCESREGRHDYVTGSKTLGPNVFYHCKSSGAHADIGPHARWSAGALYDNIVTDGDIDVQDRGNRGTGHGWTGTTQVVWNCTAKRTAVQSPWVSGKNYAIGVKGEKYEGRLKGRPDGAWNKAGQSASPPSLYLAQLRQRQRAQQ